MLTIDTYAYTNRLKQVHPFEKTIFAMMTLAVCLAFKDFDLYFFVIGSMAAIVVGIAGIPATYYLKVLTLPLPFVLMGVLTVIFNFSKDPGAFDFGFRIFSYFIGTTNRSVLEGLAIFFRTYSCVSCLYFLSLTTPIVDLVWVMRKIRIPAIFVEILSIIYRFIFELLDTALLMKTSQDSRLGYSNLKRSYRSLGLLISNLFIKSFQNYKNLSMAMESRLYQGDFRVVEERYGISFTNILFVAAYFVIVCCMILFDGFSFEG
jgi:cobalt/nickel transport system permease protein